ncbi:DNA directed RNA polymerase II 15 kDa subunit [Spraguea lophii 42_110]|uniref:DNA-directed RNA polymerase subunit n=1 Tax=Spraguea lophii (strain 42_110) TaxID=1358809 RepID=S7WAH0_SPRLO|nr:DNA directed RNA polymerase II 15 kDa subunit [Spraguea lophii 42_110]
MQDFCRECNNLLYPKEEKQDNTLYMVCKGCEHFEDAKSMIIYEEKEKHHKQHIGNLAKEYVNDNTLPIISIICPKCNYDEAVSIEPKGESEDEIFNMIYICKKCINVWTER